TVTLTASPALGSSFGGWSGGACAGAGSCVVTLGADTTVIATFDVLPPTIPPTVSIPPAVSIPPPVGSNRETLKCRKGFRKRRVRGKARCVKVKKRRIRLAADPLNQNEGRDSALRLMPEEGLEPPTRGL